MAGTHGIRRRILAAGLGCVMFATSAHATAARDVVSYTPASLLGPGEVEWRTFHSVYTQTHAFDDQGRRRETGGRSTYYTGTWSVTFGAGRWNPGVDLTVRSVRDRTFPAGQGERWGLTAIQPRVEVAPWRGRPDLALEIGARFPLGSDLEGSAQAPFLDWNDPVASARLLMDRALGGSLFAYLEAGAQVRFDREGDDAQVTTPFGAILNWIPSERWTLYVPVSAAPDWVGAPRGNYWSQTGLGIKLRPRPDLEFEALATVFPFGRNSGAGSAVHAGLRLVR